MCQSRLTGLAASGDVIIENVGTPVAYTAIVNKNARTIAGFSTGANKSMRPGDDTSKEFFPIFKTFYDYYGSYDYADRIVQAGLAGSNADVRNAPINMGTANTGFVGRAGKCTDIHVMIHQ